jgi:hypothetical protein
MAIEKSKRDLIRRLSEEFLVALQPDHPYLLFTPDLLVSNYSNLIGIFFPDNFELQGGFDYLLSRMVLSRLALPSKNFYCVLLINSDDHQLPEQAAYNFDKIVNSDDYDDLREFINQPPTRRIGDIHEVKNKFFQRFEIIYEESYKIWESDRCGKDPFKILKELKERDRGQPVPIQSWAERREESKDIRSTYLEYSGRKVIETLKCSSPSYEAKLRNLYKDGLLLCYSLDNGVPYLKKSRATTNVLIVDELPILEYDPFKLIRTTAFAGWSMVKVRSLDKLYEFINLLEEKLRSSEQ